MTPQERARLVNHHSGLSECLEKLADIFEGNANPKQVAEQLRTCAKLHHVMATHHKQAAAEIGKAAGLADSGDAIAPMPGISVIAEPPQGLRLIGRAGAHVPVAASTDEVFDKIFGGDAL